MERIQGITNRQFVAMVAIMILISLLTIVVTNYIGNKRVKQTELDSADFKLLRNFIEVKLLKDLEKKHLVKTDTLFKVDTIKVERWHKAKEIVKAAPDTCQHYIKILEHACDSMAAIKDSLISELLKVIAIKDSIEHKDSCSIELLNRKAFMLKSEMDNLVAEIDKLTRQKRWWRNAALIEGGYIILREGKSILVN
jgi:hypothetical protein